MSLLPTEKTLTGLTLETAKILLYGPPKIGKSTLASEIAPDHTLFIATEPGLAELDVYQQPCGDWKTFRDIGAALAKSDHQFEIVVIDTVDVLHKFCADAVMGEMGIKHASEGEYGAGWERITTEFSLRIAKLCSLGMGVVFISHTKEQTTKGLTGEDIVNRRPVVGYSGAYNWLTGFVDYIVFATTVDQVDDDGKKTTRRVLRLQPGDHTEAGGRRRKNLPPLPDLIPLDAGELRAAFEQTVNTTTGEIENGGKPSGERAGEARGSEGAVRAGEDAGARA